MKWGKGGLSQILCGRLLYKCDLCDELEASEPTGIGYLCCVCDA